MKKSILLLGSYGQSNIGDDLLMWNYLNLVKDQGFTTIYVNVNDTSLIPKPITKAFPNLTIINTYKTSMSDYITIIKKVDCIAYGGGTIYKELYASTGRSKYSVIIRLMGFNVIANLLKTNVYHLNIGIGSLKTWLGKFITTRALNAASLTTFRDETSYATAKNTLHISPKKIMQSTDGLFLNDVWTKQWSPIPASTAKLLKGKNVIGVNVLSDIPDWVNREHYIATMRSFLKKILSDPKNHVLFIPFQHAFNPRNDYIFTKETFGDLLKEHKNCTLPDSIPIDEIAAYLRACNVFVGMRFHGLLLSAVNHVPFVAVAYDTKCWRFVSEVNYQHAIKLEDISADALYDHYTRAKNDKTVPLRLTAISKQLYAAGKESLRTIRL